MKKTILAAILGMALVTACNSETKEGEEQAQEKVQLETLEDRVSYSLGLDRASEIINIINTNKLNEKFNMKDIEKGMINIFSKGSPQFSEEEANQTISSYMMQMNQGAAVDPEQKKNAGIAIGEMDALTVKNSLDRKDVFANLNSELMVRGVKDGFGDQKNLLIPVEETKEIIMGYFGDIYKKEGQEFLNENKEKEGVMVTESGLQYEVIQEGDGSKRPSLEEKVTVHYTGTLIDGTIFDSSYERNEPTSFPVNGVIRGWQEGLQLMSPGAKFKFYIPQDLAYGQNPPPGSTIHPFATLIFEVELIEIQ